jgi:hypothetical protein
VYLHAVIVNVQMDVEAQRSVRSLYCGDWPQAHGVT